MPDETLETVTASGRLFSIISHGTIVALNVRQADGKVVAVYCDHRPGRLIWDDLQGQDVEIVVDDDGTKYIRPA
jgi:hypothetical protein